MTGPSIAVALAGPMVVVACARAALRSSDAARSGDGADDAARRSTGRWPPAWARGALDRWAEALRRAGIDGDPHRWARVAAGGLVVAVVAAWSRAGPVGGAVTGALLLLVGVACLRASAERGPRRADAHLADLLEHTSRNLRAGCDLVSSLEVAAGAVEGLHGPEVTSVVIRARRGASLSDALASWEAAHPRPPVRLVVGALEVASITGGARARALDGVAATLRSRRAVAAEAGALAGQARASAAVLVALPVVVAVLGSAADPRLARTLLGTPVGLGCVVGAAVLDGVGALWMRRVVAEAS